MDYPDKLVAITSELLLYMPDPEYVQCTYRQLFADNPETPFPFWARYWPAARALVDFLQEECHYIKDKRVLEVGAGIGVPSFSIASKATEIIISDYSSDAVELMMKNIAFLGLRNTWAECLDWNDFPESMKADVLILSDTNYAPDQFIPLLALVNRFHTQGATILIATPQRITGSPFITQLEPLMRRSVIKWVTGQDAPIPVSLFIL